MLRCSPFAGHVDHLVTQVVLLVVQCRKIGLVVGLKLRKHVVFLGITKRVLGFKLRRVILQRALDLGPLGFHVGLVET